MFYLNSTLNFGIPTALVFQLDVYYKVDRLLTGLTAQQKGTTARWNSNKTSKSFPTFDNTMPMFCYWPVSHHVEEHRCGDCVHQENEPVHELTGIVALAPRFPHNEGLFKI